MSSVRFMRFRDTYRISFAYDPELVEWIKSIPRQNRTYEADTKTWIVDRKYAEGFASDLRAAGHTVLGLEQHTQSPPPPRRDVTVTWADTLMSRCNSEELREKCYRALAKCLHDDLGGDGRLMQELNDARNGYSARKGAAS